MQLHCTGKVAVIEDLAFYIVIDFRSNIMVVIEIYNARNILWEAVKN